MGVRGLMSKCLREQAECAEIVDLVKVAKKRKGIEILVDYHSFEFFILEAFCKSYSALCDNQYLLILGAEYSSVDAYLTKLVNDLRSLQIHLVLFKDGCKGSDVPAHKHKLETYISRHHQIIKKANSIMKVCSGQFGVNDLYDKESISYMCYPLRGPQFENTLQRCGCEFVAIASGEADYVIARALIERPTAYAVLGNDSDFFIFRECRIIPNQLFDIDESLNLGKKQQLPSEPKSLKCGIISSSSVKKLLQLKKKSDLVNLSILTGNDFTSHLIEGLQTKLDCYNLTEVIDWLQINNFETHPLVQKEVKENKPLCEAIQKSRNFYKVNKPLKAKQPSCPLECTLIDGVEAMKLPSIVMGIFNGIYWHDYSPVQYGSGISSCESALTELRTYWYRILNTTWPIREYGCTPQKSFECVEVKPADFEFSPVNLIQDDNSEDRMHSNYAIFEKIFTHYEPTFQPRYDRRYGIENGFRCMMLRYFLVMNNRYFLCISVNEFESAVAMVLGELDKDWYMKQSILPDPRCLTLISWLQKIYKHAYYYFGKALFLSDRFPEPKDVFSGSVWNAFYAVTVNPANARRKIGRDNVSRILEDKSRILDEKNDMFCAILEGYRKPIR